MLKGKVAIVTGSSSGIGAEIAFKLANECADGITLHGRREDALNNTKKSLVDNGYEERKICTVIGDISQDDIQTNLIDQTLSHFGRLDILVNNAAIFSQCPAAGGQEIFKDHFNTNFFPAVALIKRAVPALTQSKGTVINVSSSLSMKLLDGSVAYASAKAALNHFSKAAALEFGPLGIRVNVVCPGYIPSTDIHRDLGLTAEAKQQFASHVEATVPLRRNGTVQDVANAVAFLSSDSASYITGAIIPIDDYNCTVFGYGNHEIVSVLSKDAAANIPLFVKALQSSGSGLV